VDCAVPQIASGLPAGTYHIDVQLYTAGWQRICELVEDVEVGAIGCIDNDADGFCLDDDCNDTNPNIPAAVGSSCNDNDATTENDVILADGCSCAGTPISTGTELGCGVSYTSTPTNITITGLASVAHASFSLFNSSWQTQSTCFDNCDDPLVFNNLATGNYILRFQAWDASWSRICDVTEFVDLANSNLEGQAGQPFLFFDAEKVGRTANLNWVTNTSLETRHFIVEKSLDGINFDELTTIEPHRDLAGDLFYEAIDEDVVVGDNYYRMTQVLTDGSEHKTQNYKLTFDLDVQSFELFPNPTKDQIFVNLKAYEGADANIVIYNQLGQPLHSVSVEEIPGQPMPIALDYMKSGMYHLAVKVEGTKLMTKRFIIAR